MSSLPTATQRPGGRLEKTVARPSGSLRVTSSPTGLWYSSTLGWAALERLTGSPSTATSSPGVARSPSFATRPPTVTRRASIQVSISRLEPRPAAARTFCSRSPCNAGSAAGGLTADAPGGLAAGPCAGFFGLGGLGGRRFLSFNDLGLRRRQLQGLGDFLERRQLLERAQAEVVEELPRGGVEGGPAGRLAMAHRIDPAAILERLDDLAGHRDAANVLDI